LASPTSIHTESAGPQDMVSRNIGGTTHRVGESDGTEHR